MRFLSTLLASLLGTLVAFGLVLFFGFLMLIAIASSGDVAPPVSSGSVLVMDLGGPLPEWVADDSFRDVFGPGGMDLFDVKQALRKAAVDDRIEAIWLRTEGISASWATLQELRGAVADFQATGKPVYASYDGMLEEAGYYVASAADSVFGHPEALFEFNGFVLGVEFYKDLFDRLEIEPQVIRAGAYKAAVEPYLRTDLSAANAEQLRALLDAINTYFKADVAAARGTTPEALEALADGETVHSAQEALDAGLLDGLRYHDEIETHFAERLGFETADDLDWVYLGDYVDVPDDDAGLQSSGDGLIAIVYADGVIMPGPSRNDPNPMLGGTVLGADTFAEAMREAREDDDIDAVVVRINSPGGFAPAADAMRRAIELTVAEKPVVISMGGVAASGGYWMATGAETIVADPLTITGSIGVYSVFFDVGGLFSEKLGITYDDVQTSPHADIYSAMRPLTPTERRRLEASTEQTYQSFLRKVAESRNITVERAHALAQGRVWSGADALANGLVDELGPLERAVEIAAERAELDGYRRTLLPQPPTFIEELTQSLNAQATARWYAFTTTPAERALHAQAQLLQQATAQHGTVQAHLPLRLRVE